MSEQPDLLQQLKAYLKITWDDEDEALAGMIERAKAYLNDLTGVELDFEKEAPPKSLLLDYCRYVYNNASEYFEENYQQELLRLQLTTAVAAMESDDDEG